MGSVGRVLLPQKVVYLLLSILLVLAFFHPAFSMTSFIKYNGYKLYRIHLPPTSDMAHFARWLEAMEEKLNELPAYSKSNQHDSQPPLLDIWTLPSPLHRNADLLVAPNIDKAFISALRQKRRKASLVVELISEDIQKDIDSERNKIIRRKRLWRRRRRSTEVGGSSSAIKELNALDLHTYNSYPKMEQYLKKVVKENPKVAELVNLTKTFEGRDLLGVRIGRRDGDDEEDGRQLVYIDAGVHAREWIAPAAALYLIDKLISLWNQQLLQDDDYPISPEDSDSPSPSSSSSSSSISVSILGQFEFVIVPCANPDGYAFSMSRDRLWRKTRSRNETMHKWCVGADANRNWGYRWAETGSPRSPCSNIFPGRAPFSEPEVLAVKDFLSRELGRLVAYISLHSYGQLVLSPWGFSTAKPSNHKEQQKLATLIIDAIRETTGTEYTFGSIADLLYPASGTSIDYWQYRGVPYIYGVELRPEDVESEIHGFAIPPEQIEPSGREVFTMVKRIVEYVSESRSGSEEADGKGAENGTEVPRERTKRSWDKKTRINLQNFNDSTNRT
uniref:Peptidase M14 carboxypeptidase A domain-containing protein n=1 Tax=Globodera rostochiensis TaxID=31243 RepID=A0A914HRG4_GLORO